MTPPVATRRSILAQCSNLTSSWLEMVQCCFDQKFAHVNKPLTESALFFRFPKTASLRANPKMVKRPLFHICSMAVPETYLSILFRNDCTEFDRSWPLALGPWRANPQKKRAGPSAISTLDQQPSPLFTNLRPYDNARRCNFIERSCPRGQHCPARRQWAVDEDGSAAELCSSRNLSPVVGYCLACLFLDALFSSCPWR
jgi:hypothetical protein